MGPSLPKPQPQNITIKDVERFRSILAGKEPLDVMLVGNTVGKTSMLSTYGATKDSNNPDLYYCTTKHRGGPVKIRLHDCSASDLTRHVNHYQYPISVTLLCYAVNDWASLLDLSLSWLPELSLYRIEVPYLVCGCKKDVREASEKSGKKGRPLIGHPEGRFFATEILARGFFECSTTQSKEVQAVLDSTFRFGIIECEKKLKVWEQQTADSTDFFSKVWK